MNDILCWKQTIDRFVDQYARSHDKDRKDDLRQDIYVAILEEKNPITSEDRVLEIASNVVDKNHSNRVFEERFIDLGTAAPSLGLDSTVDVRLALQSLPDTLHDVAVDLFVHELTLVEVSNKYNRSTRWVSGIKRRILDDLQDRFDIRRS